MFTTVCSAAVYGLQAYLVRVEVDLCADFAPIPGRDDNSCINLLI